MSKTKAGKRANKDIRIKCDFVIEVNNIFHHFSSQLSDGYWENSGGEWGEYEDRYYPGIWNCFNFGIDKHGNFVITLKSSPTWDDAKADCDKYHAMSDKEIVDYLKTALFDSIDDCIEAFSFEYSAKELNVIKECISDWEILPPPLPQLTHEQLVKIVGYDFEYKR